MTYQMELEDWVLLKLIKNPSSLAMISSKIAPYHFTDKSKKKTYEGILRFIEEVPKLDENYQPIFTSDGKPVTTTIITPTYQSILESDKDGAYVSQITNYDEPTNREIALVLSDMVWRYKVESVKKAFSNGLAQLDTDKPNLDSIISECFTMANLATMDQDENPFINQVDVRDEYKERQKILRENGGNRILTGIKCLDYLLAGGLMRGDFMMIGSTTGQGKSMLAGQLMVNFHYNKLKVGILGLEMDHTEYFKRQVSLLAELLGKDWMRQSSLNNPSKRQADPNDEKYIEDEVARFNFTYLKVKQISLSDMKKYFQLLIEKHKCDVIFLDHLLLIDEPKMEERLKVGEIANFMKLFAAQHNIVCVGVGQMNRDTLLEDPKTSDLSGGRGIEQACTQFITIGMPKGKDKTNDRFAVQTSFDPSLRKITLLKSRHSMQGRDRYFYANFRGDSCFFSESKPDNWDYLMERDDFEVPLNYRIDEE